MINDDDNGYRDDSRLIAVWWRYDNISNFLSKTDMRDGRNSAMPFDGLSTHYCKKP